MLESSQLTYLCEIVLQILLSYSGRFFYFFPVRQLKNLRMGFAIVTFATIVIGSLMYVQRNAFAYCLFTILVLVY